MPRLSKIGAAALGAFGWTSGSSISASYLVVAGGGSGGRENISSGTGGGGGAGGLLTGTTSLNPTLSYAVTVGAGGAVSGSSGTVGSNGSSSVFNAITSIGGGGGGGGASLPASGAAGGSGGGAAGTAGSTTFGAGTVGQGNNGGTGGGGGGGAAAGGGGGAGAVGGNATTTNGGAGGAGTASSISGSSVTYAGGGGGSSTTGGSAGAGGSGGGGAGAQYVSGGATAGTANLGGGGGGGSNNPQPAGAGGSGVVIISYLGAQQFGGGVVTSSGSNTIHTFTTSGTLSPLSTLTASYLIVAGGGSGGGTAGGRAGGGGGAGGLLSGSGVTIDTNSTYLVTVGAGGTGVTGTIGANGVNSTFSLVPTVAVGGGGGGNDGSVNGLSGGSGGGGSATGSGGSATSGQGNTGGTGGPASTNYTGGGGGGASAVGGNGASSVAGNGGAGSASSISGTSTTYAGGGGGGSYNGGTAGTGGSGGGGAGFAGNGNGVAGTTNLGAGGGGAGSSGSNYAGGNGGSGVVVISYAGATQQMAGGTVTISGGNVIHTFTSSGYLTPLKLVNNSLRFRSSASAYLNRTPPTAGNLQKWTWSAWVKRGALSYGEATLFNAGTTGIGTNDTGFLGIRFTSGDKLDVTTGLTDLRLTTQVFRDPAAWYHIVVAVDTTQTTGANRVNVYINGTQVTAYAGTDPSLNLNTAVNNTYLNEIGRTSWNSAGYFDGYMTEVQLIDGQQLTPNSFGTFNSYGVWQPITYGGSYGTNGFYLPFTNKTSTTTLGYDFSPAGNNWTTNNISLTTGSTYDSMTDVPTLTSATAANYCVMNPLSALNSTASDGNLKGTLNAASVTTDIYGTMASGTTGKFYWETTYVSRSGNSALTTGGVRSDVFGAEPSGTGGFGYYSVGGQVFVNGSTVATYATYTTSDVIGIALDLTNSQVSFYKQTSGTGSFVLQGTVSISSGYSWIPGYANGTSSGNQVVTVNFGQQPFNNSSPPSGFLALNTYNI